METYSSFVNVWECDENNHWNVQFYFRAFQLAAEVLAIRAGQPNPGSRTAICRHVRFHRELLSGDSLRVRSAMLGDGELAGCIVHLLEEAESGEIAATSVDHAGYRTAELPTCTSLDVQSAIPRSITPGPTMAADTAPLLNSKHAFVSTLDIVRPIDMDHNGDILSDRILSRSTDTAAHVWKHAGIGAGWMAEQNYGRVAVEMKLTRLASINCGEAIRLVSWATEPERKTFRIRHQMENVATGEAIAALDIRCLMLDLESRKAVPLPEEIHSCIARTKP